MNYKVNAFFCDLQGLVVLASIKRKEVFIGRYILVSGVDWIENGCEVGVGCGGYGVYVGYGVEIESGCGDRERWGENPRISSEVIHVQLLRSC